MDVLISGAVTAICLVAALLMWTVGGKHWPYVILALVATGFGGIMQTKIGDTVRSGTNSLNDALSKALGRYGVEITMSVLAVLLVIFVAYKLIKRREIDLLAIGTLALTVLLSASIPGLVGSVLAYLFGCVEWLVVAGIGLLFGIS